MTRKNIKLPEALFARLKNDKPEHMSWAMYFETQCLASDDPDSVTLHPSERTKLVRSIADEITDEQ